MAANIVITGASLSPNPVQTEKTFMISVEITDRLYVLSTAEGKWIKTADGDPIIVYPETVHTTYYLETADGLRLLTADGEMIKAEPN